LERQPNQLTARRTKSPSICPIRGFDLAQPLENRVRVKTILTKRFNAITPSSRLEKIFNFSFSEIYDFLSSSRLDQEGRFAIVTNVEVGCGGRVVVAAWLVHADEQQRCARSSRVVLIPRCWYPR
jgi:tRNA(His) 5'-end guanylyltransferase